MKKHVARRKDRVAFSNLHKASHRLAAAWPLTDTSQVCSVKQRLNDQVLTQTVFIGVEGDGTDILKLRSACD